METSTFATETLSFLVCELADGIDVHRGYSSWRLVWGAVLGMGSCGETGGLCKIGPVSDGVHTFGDGFCSCDIGWLLDCDERADMFLEALHIEMHAGGGIHVRKVEHDGSEFVAVLVDGGALGETTEAIVGIGGDVDGDELLPEGNREVMPGRGVCVSAMPDEVTGICPVPKGSIFFEEGGGEWDSARDEDGKELVVLLHLEYPGF
jgi:hypothetical protein